MDIPVVVNDLPLIISDTPKGCLFIYKDSITENTFTSLDWFEKECLLHACTLKGRKDAFRKITGTSQKPPYAKIARLSHDRRAFSMLMDNNTKTCSSLLERSL